MAQTRTAFFTLVSLLLLVPQESQTCHAAQRPLSQASAAETTSHPARVSPPTAEWLSSTPVSSADTPASNGARRNSFSCSACVSPLTAKQLSSPPVSGAARPVSNEARRNSFSCSARVSPPTAKRLSSPAVSSADTPASKGTRRNSFRVRACVSQSKLKCVSPKLPRVLHRVAAHLLSSNAETEPADKVTVSPPRIPKQRKLPALQSYLVNRGNVDPHNAPDDKVYEQSTSVSGCSNGPVPTRAGVATNLTSGPLAEVANGGREGDIERSPSSSSIYTTDHDCSPETSHRAQRQPGAVEPCGQKENDMLNDETHLFTHMNTGGECEEEKITGAVSRPTSPVDKDISLLQAAPLHVVHDEPHQQEAATAPTDEKDDTQGTPADESSPGSSQRHRGPVSNAEPLSLLKGFPSVLRSVLRKKDATAVLELAHFVFKLASLIINRGLALAALWERGKGATDAGVGGSEFHSALLKANQIHAGMAASVDAAGDERQKEKIFIFLEDSVDLLTLFLGTPMVTHTGDCLRVLPLVQSSVRAHTVEGCFDALYQLSLSFLFVFRQTEKVLRNALENLPAEKQALTTKVTGVKGKEQEPKKDNAKLRKLVRRVVSLRRMVSSRGASEEKEYEEPVAVPAQD